LASEAADGAERSCGRGPSGWITCVGFVVFGLAVSKYQSGEGTKKPLQKPFLCEPREPHEPREPRVARVQALDYGLASSFEKLRAQRQPMIQEISEQLGVAQMAGILLKLGRQSNTRSQGSKNC